MAAINWNGAAARRTMRRVQLNPRRYNFGQYFGNRLHMDQNEKLICYGIVFVAAVDAHSSFIFDVAVMPRTNNLAIYEGLYRPIVERYGLFRRIVLDKSNELRSEFRLTLYMQQYYWTRIDPANKERLPSVENTRIARLWVEIDQRIGYPMKEAFLQMEESGLADAENPCHLFSMSLIGRRIAKYGLDVTTKFLNYRHITGRGKPVQIKEDSKRTQSVLADELLDAKQALAHYQRSGNRLTEPSDIGIDLLSNSPRGLALRDEQFENVVVAQVGGDGVVFDALASKDFVPFQTLVSRHIQLTEQLHGIYGDEDIDESN